MATMWVMLIGVVIFAFGSFLNDDGIERFGTVMFGIGLAAYLFGH